MCLAPAVPNFAACERRPGSLRCDSPMHPRHSFAFCALALALAHCAGCAGAPRPLVHHGGGETQPVAAAVTGENYTDMLRELDQRQPTAAIRALRDSATRHEATLGMEHVNDGDTDAAIQSLRLALVHYSPDEIRRGGLPMELGPLARGIFEQVAPRGDEAHALAAARVLMALASADPDAQTRLDAIQSWGESNRREFRSAWVAAAEMADIYREASRIVAAPDLLERFTQYELDRRNAARHPTPPRHPTPEDMAQLRAASRGDVIAAEIAVVHLRTGDIAAAAEQVARLADGAQSEPELATLLRAIAGGDGGADGLVRLVERLRSADPAAAEGVCRRALRDYATDARFASCLGAAAATEHMLGLASAHFELASRLVPEDRRVLELALRASVQWLSSELVSDDASAGRRAVSRTQALLQTWQQHFHEPAPVTDADLESIAAQLELGQANLAGAQQHLERATHAVPPSREAFLTLAEISWRSGDPRQSLAFLAQGVALPVQPTESDSTFRPTFHLHMGLAAHSAGDETRARSELENAATALDALTHSLDGEEQANAHFLRAVALDGIGRTGEVRGELDAALAANPESRDLAGHAITFALARGRWADARDFASAARTRLTLDRTWQVYFALWGAYAARLGRFDSDGGASDALRDLAATATEHSAWTVRLAQRYSGLLRRDELERYAGNAIGHRAEAAFYEALFALGTGDDAAAERDLRATTATRMLRFYEYEMAWTMLARGVPSLHTDGSSSSAPAALPAATSAATPSAASPGPAPARRPARRR